MNRRPSRTDSLWTLILLTAVVAAALYHRDKFRDIIILSPSSAVPKGAVLVLCERVIDGDSLVVRHSGKTVEVRLEGIDCPEFDQPFRDEAKTLAAALCQQKELRMQTIGYDKYGRQLVRIFAEEIEVNAELVKAGLAWDYGRSERLSREQSEARSKKLGIWSQRNPIPPWEWRTRNSGRLPHKSSRAVRIGTKERLPNATRG